MSDEEVLIVEAQDYDATDRSGEDAGVWLGVQACIGTFWWLLNMFVYVKNTSADADITLINGSATVPVGWWWERAGELNGVYVYLAISLIMTFIFYFFVSVIEMVAWIIYMH